MFEVDNSDIMKNVLTTILSISTRKSSQGTALSTIDSLLKQLGRQYVFLKYVRITDTRFSEGNEAIRIMPDINTVEATYLGRAIHDIVSTMSQSLGMDAGFYFIRELQKRLGDEYSSLLWDMGVDLGMMQLESEVVSRMKNKYE